LVLFLAGCGSSIQYGERHVMVNGVDPVDATFRQLTTTGATTFQQPPTMSGANIQTSTIPCGSINSSSACGSGYPAGNAPQIGGFSAANVAEAETVSGDCTYTRTGSNAYSITCTKINGTTPGGSCSTGSVVTSISASGVPTCGAAGGIVPHTLTGATPTAVVSSTSVPATDVENYTLGANCTSFTLPGSTGVADGEVLHIKVVQPSGSHSYTFPTTLTGGSGTQVVFMATGGCASMPTMPTGTGHTLLLDVVYNANTPTPTYDIVSCPTDGS